MLDLRTFRKGWALLDSREKHRARLVLAVAVIAALASAVMVGSVLPFLSVLADPGIIHENANLSWAYDTFGFSSDYVFLTALGLISLAVIVLSNAIQILRVFVVTRFAMMRAHSISRKLLASYLRQPYEFFLDSNSSELGSKILAEAQQVVQLYFRPMAEVIASILTVTAIVTLLVILHPTIALITFGVMGGVYALTYLVIRRFVARWGQTRMLATRRRFRLANEVMGGVKDIKLLGHERTYLDLYSEPSAQLAVTAANVSVAGQVPQYVVQAAAFGGIVVLCLVLMTPQTLGTDNALGGILPLLGLFALAGQRLIPEFSRLYVQTTQLTYGRAAVDAVHDDLVALDRGRPLARTRPAPLGLKRELRLEGVGYRYPNAETAGLSDVSLTIAGGERIGIVGSTGAGKTTLADIVLGLLRPHAGRILADGAEVDDDTLAAWFQTVGYVPQEIFLIDASIRENIALGIPRAEIDEDKMLRAARIARVHDFVTAQLDHVYDTQVGERGVRLSGGQRQRLGIARALYHDADLIVLDEATSALDNLTEAEVMSAIDALPGDKTVIMIAHRLSTLRGCDRIVVLDGGRVMGFDHWDTLMRDNPVFRGIAQVADVA
jgi:ABC-type bacteriocin/lantibiotic exporter with double-glycine peptidase domain